VTPIRLGPIITKTARDTDWCMWY